MNYEKLILASKMFVESLQEFDGEFSEEEVTQRTQSVFQQVLEGEMFPEIGKPDTQQKVDATAVFLVKLSQSGSNEESLDATIKGMCERAGHPEVFAFMSTAIKMAVLLTEWLRIYPDEITENFPNTGKYYQEHKTDLEFSRNNIVHQTIAGESGKDEQKYLEGTQKMLMSYIEMYKVFQDETGYSDEECADLDFMTNMIETWVLPID